MSSGFREKYSLPRAVARTLLFQILSKLSRLFFHLHLSSENIGLRLLFFLCHLATEMHSVLRGTDEVDAPERYGCDREPSRLNSPEGCKKVVVCRNPVRT